MFPPIEILNRNDITIQHSLDGFSYVCIINNTKHSFVPASVFQEKDKAKYLDFLGLMEDNGVVLTDYVSEADAYNVYLISEKDYKIITDSSEKIEYHHASSLLVADLIKQNRERTDDPKVYLHVNDRNFEMIVLKGANLLFDNSFRFKTKEDFLYFLLFSMEQLKLDAETVPVYFMGMIEEESEIAKLVSKYVRNIHFLRKNNANN